MRPPTLRLVEDKLWEGLMSMVEGKSVTQMLTAFFEHDLLRDDTDLCANWFSKGCYPAIPD